MTGGCAADDPGIASWSVRTGAAGDAAAIRPVHTRAFAPSDVEPRLVDALRADGDLVGRGTTPAARRSSGAEG